MKLAFLTIAGIFLLCTFIWVVIEDRRQP